MISSPLKLKIFPGSLPYLSDDVTCLVLLLLEMTLGIQGYGIKSSSRDQLYGESLHLTRIWTRLRKIYISMKERDTLKINKCFPFFKKPQTFDKANAVVQLPGRTGLDRCYTYWSFFLLFSILLIDKHTHTLFSTFFIFRFFYLLLLHSCFLGSLRTGANPRSRLRNNLSYSGCRFFVWTRRTDLGFTVWSCRLLLEVEKNGILSGMWRPPQKEGWVKDSFVTPLDVSVSQTLVLYFYLIFSVWEVL